MNRITERSGADAATAALARAPRHLGALLPPDGGSRAEPAMRPDAGRRRGAGRGKPASIREAP